MNTVAIKFRLYCSQTRVGEIVKVSGSGPELGNWNPANALTLHTTKEEFPIWRAGIFIDSDRQPDPDNFEYKYIIVPFQSSNDTDVVQENIGGAISLKLVNKAKPVTPFWENFEGNRMISLAQMGEILLQDVFNEKDLIKLEMHQEQSNGLRSLNSRIQSSRKTQLNHLGQERKFSLPQNLMRKEPGFETVSHDVVLIKPTFQQKKFDQNKFQNYMNVQTLQFGDQKNGAIQLNNFQNYDTSMMQIQNQNTSFGGDNAQKTQSQITDQHILQILKNQLNDQNNNKQKGELLNNSNQSSLNFEEQKKPNSDFQLQKNKEQQDIESRKFVKMTRIVRNYNEDELNIQSNPIAQAKRIVSQPYFLDDERNDQLDFYNQKNYQMIQEQYVPIYELNKEKKYQIAAPLNIQQTQNQINNFQKQGIKSEIIKDHQIQILAQQKSQEELVLQNQLSNSNIFSLKQQYQIGNQAINQQSLMPEAQKEQTLELINKIFIAQSKMDNKISVTPFEQQQFRSIFPSQDGQILPTKISNIQPLSQLQNENLLNQINQKQDPNQNKFKQGKNHNMSQFFKADQDQIKLNSQSLSQKSSQNKKEIILQEHETQMDTEELDFDFSTEEEVEKKLMDTQIKLGKNDSLVVMSFKLPISVVRHPDGQLTLRESKSMLYPTIFNLREKGMLNFQWIGWPGIIPKNEEEKELIQQMLKTQKCYAIWLKQDEIEDYLLFNEQFLRPLFHHFKGTNEQDIDQKTNDIWHTYCDINAKFVDGLLEIKQESDMVWIHDIYLLLTPFYLKRKLLNSNIGFFIHSPFPSSDIFQTFQYRTEILKSLLCCDVIGFHLFEYARNFFTACRKILELYTINKKGGFLGIEYNGRTIILNVNHIGINQDTIKQMVSSKQFKQFKDQLSYDIQFKKVILASVDRLHPISGIRSKLEGYRHFLKQNAPHRQNICLIQYVSQGEFDYQKGENNEDSIQKAIDWHSENSQKQLQYTKSKSNKWIQNLAKQTLQDIQGLVNEIHEEFGQGCLIFRIQNLSQQERCALWSFSHSLINTSLRDGLCLPPLEFVKVKKQQDKFQKASLILSEFSGCSRALGGAHLINPYDTDAIAQSISQVIDTKPYEKQERMEQIFEYINRHSTIKWAEKFLLDLKRAYDPFHSQYEKTGFGVNWQIIKFKQGFKELQSNILEDSYSYSSKRLIVIDQEGVIPMKQRHGKHEPTIEAIEALNAISEHKENIVFIVSTESKQLMHQWYHEKAPYLGIAAENGFFWRWQSKGKQENEWNELLEVEDFEWINQVRLLMIAYKEKTDGSYIEEKESSIIWNYKNTDLEFGQMQAKELTQQITNIFSNFPIEIIESKTSVQVVPQELKKEKLIRTLIEKQHSQYGNQDLLKKKLDFILYIGDVGQTEQVFRYLNRIQTKQERIQKQILQLQNSKNPKQIEQLQHLQAQKSKKQNISQDINVYTCTIGKRATQAKYFVSDPNQIVHILEQLNDVQDKIKDGVIPSSLGKFGKNLMNQSKSKRMNSLANFGNNFKAFGKLVESNIGKDQIVNTKFGGNFTRHSLKLKSKLSQQIENKTNGSNIQSKIQKIESVILMKSDQKLKSGIYNNDSQKKKGLAKKLGSSNSSIDNVNCEHDELKKSDVHPPDSEVENINDIEENQWYLPSQMKNQK